LVIFKDLIDLNNTVSYIENFKNKTFKDSNVELHFNKESLSIKKKFFNIFNKNLFKIRYYKIESLKYNLSDIDYVIKCLIENRDSISNSIIYIDGLKSKNYNRKIITKIKITLKSHKIPIKSIKYTDSKNSPLIQLADMCAGCIRRRFERNNVEDRGLYNIIEKFMS
jgi:hypothetical protein